MCCQEGEVLDEGEWLTVNNSKKRKGKDKRGNNSQDCDIDSQAQVKT